MTVFQQLRVWFRRASTAERSTTAAAVIVAAALVGWLVVPVHHASTTVGLQTGGGSGAGPAAETSGAGPAGGAGQSGSAAASGPSSPSASAAAPSAATATGSGAGSTGSGRGGGSPVAPGSSGPGSASGGGAAGNSEAAAGSTGSSCPPTVDQGVTSNQINLAVTIIDIAGSAGNQTVGVPTPQQQQADWQYVADAVNASGGAACRKLVLHFYNVNPVDSNNAQQQCLAIAASHPFLAIDTGSLTAVGASDCIPEQKIPLVGFGLSVDQLQKYYPYYISAGDVSNDAIHDGVYAWKQLGYLSPAKGFKKLGLLYHDCIPALVAYTRQSLQQVGVPSSAILPYDLGCPPGQQDNPADLEQAVLNFRNHGVTDVTETAVSDFAQFTQVAQQQGWRPDHYILADGGLVGVNGSLQPDPTNFNGAIDIVDDRYGEQTTPGYRPSGATAQCNAIFAARKQPPVYQQPDGYGGIICGLIFFVQSLVDHAPQLKRDALVSGMHAIGLLDSSFPNGPANYADVPPGAAYGRGYWRLDQYVGSCSCWRVPDPTFNPPFT